MTQEEFVERVEAWMSAVDRRLTAIEVRVGIRPDPAVQAAIEAAQRPRRSFEDMVMERTLRDHPTTKQFAEAAERAVPDGLVRAIAGDRHNPRSPG